MSKQVIGRHSSSDNLSKRAEAVVEAARATGLDLSFVSQECNQLGLAPSSIAALLHALERRNDNYLEVREGQHGDKALDSFKWGFSSIPKYSSLLCIRSPNESTSSTIQIFSKVIEQSLDDYHLIEKQSLAQSLAVEIGRQAQNETLLDIRAPGKSQRNLDEMGNVDLDKDIFANVARYMCKILQADGCAIFDLSEFRMTQSTHFQTRSHDSSAVIEDSIPGNSEASSTSDKHIRFDEKVSNFSPLQSAGSSQFTSSSHSVTQTREHFVSSGGGKTYCSFFNSPFPVRILGHSGKELEHFQKLSGTISKPIIAQYLSMTRSSGLNSKATIESKASPERNLTALAPAVSKTILCCSVAEADSQPAYLIFAYFTTEEVEFDRTDQLFIEQLGTYLIYSSIRSRVIAVDRAQMRFTQRIQHELRTPLHAIIGINEIAKQSLDSTFNFTEMKELIDSIGASADSLNLLVDDMVDFSLMERLSGERKSFQTDNIANSDWEFVCGGITSTSLYAFALCQRMNRLQLQEENRPSPPELIVVVDDLNKFDWKTLKSHLDLEVIRRIIWKLVMNAIQATSQGLISIIISYQPAVDNEKDGASVDRLKVEVQDTGKGMDQKFVEERLFYPFGKEDEESGGVGLSLSICQHLSAQMSGRILAESKVGIGTKMTVTLPLKKSNKVKMEPSNSSGKGLLAFLGFDTPSKRLYIASLLKQFGCRQTKELDKACIVILSIDELHLQEDYQKHLQILSSKQCQADVVLMPTMFLREMDLERSKRLEEMELLLGRDCHIFDRPMDLQRIQEFAELLKTAQTRVFLNGSTEVIQQLDVLPAAQSGGDGLRRDSNSSTTGEAPPDNHPFTVLVVEDNPLNARIMTTMLKRANLEYYLAINGLEGVELFKKHLPILTLLDINMPVMNGFDACVEMRRIETPYKHKIIAITALSTEAEKRKGSECGLDDWLTKPTRMIPLLSDIKRWRREYSGKPGSAPSTPSSTGGGIKTS